jgi:tetratricopeptide (TPR) repeat protein
MKKPIYQQGAIRILWIVSGAQALLGLTQLFGDPYNWLSIRAVCIFTLVSFVAYILLTIFFRYRRIPWVTDDNRLIHVVRLGRKNTWLFIGGLLMLWAGAIVNERRKTAPVIVEQVKQIPVIHPIFDTADTRFKILILSWEQECEYQGKKYNIGLTLKNRIDELAAEYKIPIHTYYLKDLPDLNNLTHKRADSLMKFNGADHILYGSYSLKECEGDNKDKVCFNYQTNISNWRMAEVNSYTQYKMTAFDGLDDIRKGNGHEGIDYIVYWAISIAEIKRQKFTEAISILKKIKGYEKNESILFQIGVCYYNLNDYANSQYYNQEVLRINPANTEAAVHLGVCLSKQDRMEEAKLCMENVLYYCPSNISALRNLGNIYIAKKDSMTGKVYLAKILQLTPPDNTLHLTIHAAVLNDMGMFQDAKRCINKVLETDSVNTDNWGILAAINKHLKDTAGLFNCYNKIVKLDPYDAATYFDLAQLYEGKKEYNKAEAHYLKAIQINPHYDEAWSSLGFCYHFAGENTKAQECVEKAVVLNPNNFSALCRAYYLFKNLDNVDKQITYLEIVLKRYTTDATLWNNLGILYNRKDKFIKALPCFKRTLDMLPANAGTYYNLSATYSCMRNKKVALQYLAKAMDCDATRIKDFVTKDRSFFWLYGRKELCDIIE